MPTRSAMSSVADAVGVGLEDGHEPGQPGQPVALGGVTLAVVVDRHWTGG